MKQVLVLCTGNACRSIMAEALINHRRANQYHAVSAGSAPKGSVHPKTTETLKRHGIHPDAPRSKSWDEIAGGKFDLVITVCDQAASEICPVFAGRAERLHWSIPDPAGATGSEQDIDKAFDDAFRMLKTRIDDALQ